MAHRALLPIGPTPTDLLAATGEVTHVDAEVARLVARRLAEGLEIGIEELAERLKDEIAARLADAVARTCVERSHPGARWEGGLATVLEPTPPGAFLGLSAHLNSPVVGLGAPAATLIPRAAARLGTECLVPEGAEVGGAVGAAVAAVRGIVHVTVRAAYGVAGISHYVVHSRLKPEYYEEREPALARARILAEKLARAEALAGTPAGTDGIRVSIDAEESAARDAGGSLLWLETTLRATARITDRVGEGRSGDH
jgi:N-methylhydantoinase A/oxoprolinase/acetone carboxylase beta subunit